MSDESRNLEEDCTIERVKAAQEGDMGTAKLDDAMRRATPLLESGGLSPFAFNLIGSLHRGCDEGLSLAEQRANYIRRHDGSTKMIESWDSAIGQLRNHPELLPKGLFDGD